MKFLFLQWAHAVGSQNASVSLKISLKISELSLTFESLEVVIEGKDLILSTHSVPMREATCEH